MAIRISFFTFIIPLSNVEKYYHGGMEVFKKEHTEDYEFDNFLCRTATMSWADMGEIIKFWQSLGAVGIVEENGMKKFQDFCLSEYMQGGDYLPCDWLVFDDKYSIVWHIDDNSKPI